jgi:hypothetical protein
MSQQVLITVPLQLFPAIFILSILPPMAFAAYYFNRKSPANRLFALILLVLFGWAMTGAMYMYFPFTPHVWVAVQMAVAIFLGPLFYFFARHIGREDYRPKPVEYLIWLPTVHVLIICFLRIFVSSFSADFAQKISVADFTLTRENDIHYVIYTLGIFGESVASFTLIGIQIPRQTDKASKNRLKSIFSAFLLLAISLFVFNSLANFLGYALNPNISILILILTTIWILRSLVRDRSWKIEQLLELVNESSKALEREKEKSDRLLRNILPKEVAQELKETGKVTPVYYESVSVLFTDFEGFFAFFLHGNTAGACIGTRLLFFGL